jgi:ABC transporter substrate binding protein
MPWWKGSPPAVTCWRDALWPSGKTACDARRSSSIVLNPCGLVPRQLFGFGRSDRSSKLIRGFQSKTVAGFRSRRGRCHEPTPVTPHYASFASYKTAGVHCGDCWGRGMASGGMGAEDCLPIIGFLGSVSLVENSRLYVAAFRRGLKERDYVEGQNCAIEYRWAEGRSEHLPGLMRDLVSRAAVIATHETASAVAAKAATTTIPIVFATGGDPISFGLVVSLARPSENITGVSFLNNAPEVADIQAAAEMLGHKLVVLGTGNANELDAAFARATAQRVDALAVAACVPVGPEPAACRSGAPPSPADDLRPVAPRAALRAPALGAASALTRPNQSAQRWLASGVLTMKVAGPNNLVTKHCVEHRDHLAHDRDDRDLVELTSGLETIVERLEHRIPIARAHRRHVKHVANWGTTAPDAAFPLSLPFSKV